MRVAAGAIARKYLRLRLGVEIRGYLRQLGPLVLDVVDLATVDDNPFFCADPARVPELEAYMDALRKEGNSIGARINVIASGVPAGLGEPVFDKLEAGIAHALMGINAVRAVELGAGFAVVTQKGTEHRDEITPAGFRRNASGGILGGISTGQDILVSMALKPTSSIRLPGDTVDDEGEPAEVATTGRHDPCVGLRAVADRLPGGTQPAIGGAILGLLAIASPYALTNGELQVERLSAGRVAALTLVVAAGAKLLAAAVAMAEAMLALVLMDHYLRHRAQNADVQPLTPAVEAGRARS